MINMGFIVIKVAYLIVETSSRENLGAKGLVGDQHFAIVFIQEIKVFLEAHHWGQTAIGVFQYLEKM